MKILLLEDDVILNETLELFLTRAGYDVDVALSMEEAEDLTFDNSYDLYLLDINLPEGSGIELLESLRFADDDTSTIFITALEDIETMAKSFDLGAIDYIKKPFAPQELLIRIGAKFNTKDITYKHIIYDSKSNFIRSKGQIVDLGNVQLDIFKKLLSNIGELVLKEDLYTCLDHESDTALRVSITKIKQKLDIDITNIRAKGYMLEKL